MLKLALFLSIGIIGFIAYTGIDISNEYEAISEIRNDAFNEVIDPLTKKILSEAANSNLDEILNKAVDGLKDNGGAQ